MKSSGHRPNRHMGLARGRETDVPGHGLRTCNRVLIFNIGDNKYRLIAVVDFGERIMVIKSVMSHEEYSRETF
jgi:mRNA-degrading endonuclease HigB of HigAB toxin-antitoxin module